MKWKVIIEDYFSFSKPQRRSILLAISMIIICLVVRFSYPYFFSVKMVPVDSVFLQDAARLTRPDTSQPRYANRYTTHHNDENEEAVYKESYKNDPSGTYSRKGELFAFDPNTLNTEGWKRLGLRDKTIATIQNYLAKGGHFRKPEDIRRIYGLFPDEAERLLPYIKIAIAGNAALENAGKEEHHTATIPKPYVPSTIDINTADTADFIALPGIRNTLASRIVNFRNKLGGFYSVDQIGETYGLPDSAFQKIKSRLIVGNAELKKLNINTLDATSLKTNPYIRWNVANAIVQYRQQHGNYTSLNDLKKIAIIDEQLWVKMQPYLTIE